MKASHEGHSETPAGIAHHEAGHGNLAMQADRETNPLEASREAGPNSNETSSNEASQQESSAEAVQDAPAESGEVTGAEREVPSTTESAPEIPKEPINLEKLYSESIVENPDAELDIYGQMQTVENSLATLSQNIESLKASIEKKKGDMADIRKQLGTEVPAGGEHLREEDHLEQLLEQQEGLEAKKEEAEELQEMQDVMDEIDKMPPEVRIYIIQNGTTPEGQPLKTKSGKEVNPEVAKSLAQSVEDGVKKLTKAVLKVALGIVKGVLKGVFAVLKGGMEERA